MTPTTETPSAPSKPGEWHAMFDRFDTAAQEWGWHNGRMYTQTTLPIAAEYVAARLAMLECFASLERERDEARRERDNPDYTTEDYHRLHRAHCATEDARRKAVKERDRLLKALAPFGEEAISRFNLWKNDNDTVEISVGDLRDAAYAISTLDPKGDKP